MKKMEYRQPTAALILYQNEDIITTSPGIEKKNWWDFFPDDSQWTCGGGAGWVDITGPMDGTVPNANSGWRDRDEYTGGWKYWSCNDSMLSSNGK